jgi:hypothetical protein
MERGSEALQPTGRHFPIAIAARPAQQIEVMPRAFNKSRAQLAEKLWIVAGCSRKMGINCIAKICHDYVISIIG